MPEDPNRLPRDPEPTPPGGEKRNVGLLVGLGCLGVVVLSCFFLSYWVQTFGFRWILKQGEGTRSWASRVVLSGALEGIRSSCVDGVAGEDVQQWFHPDMTVESRDRLCTIDEATIQRIATPDLVTVENLAATGLTDLATPFGVDPTLCYRYTTETVHIVGCFDADDASSAIPYEILEVQAAQP